jgi:hypothetical protein
LLYWSDQPGPLDESPRGIASTVAAASTARVASIALTAVSATRMASVAVPATARRNSVVGLMR